MAQTKKSTQSGRGGKRPGAGRKSIWGEGVVLKTMRLPASLEDELKRYALEKITQSNTATKPSAPKRKRRKKVSQNEFPFWVVWSKKEGVLMQTVSRDMLESMNKAMAIFGKEWHELHEEGWIPVEAEIVVPDWAR